MIVSSSPMLDDATYTCDACGEDIVIPVDATAGPDQEFVEDCPVCCHPHVLTVRIGSDGLVVVAARRE